MTILRRPKHSRIASVNAKIGRNINRSIILNSIRKSQPISRTTISTLTGLNKSTVSNIVESLVDENLVEEDVAPNQNIGRNPINLRVKKGQHFVGALYVATAQTEIAVVDIDGTIKSHETINTEMDQPRLFLQLCLDHLNKLRLTSGVSKLKGIGISVAGIVDSLKSKVIYAPNLGWKDLDLGQIIHELDPAIGEITIENDAKASALAELLLGRHESIPTSIVFLSVGYGIGAGLVIENHILSGYSHAAGEFGHMTIVEGGELCSCGNQGCWEVYASDRATLRRYSTAKGLTPEQTHNVLITDIIEAAKKGDGAARKALEQTAKYLGVGIANIVCSSDPEIIIIGGSVTQAWDIVYPQIIETVQRRGFLGSQRSNLILPTSLAGNPSLLGAAALSIQKIFADYRIAL